VLLRRGLEINASRHGVYDDVSGSERTHLWVRNVGQELHAFAADAAQWILTELRASGYEIDSRSMAAVTAKRQWLAGAITDAQLDSAKRLAEAVDLPHGSASDLTRRDAAEAAMFAAEREGGILAAGGCAERVVSAALHAAMDAADKADAALTQARADTVFTPVTTEDAVAWQARREDAGVAGQRAAMDKLNTLLIDRLQPALPELLRSGVVDISELRHPPGGGLERQPITAPASILITLPSPPCGAPPRLVGGRLGDYRVSADEETGRLIESRTDQSASEFMHAMYDEKLNDVFTTVWIPDLSRPG
jgi:hypothetical protein